MSLLTLSKFWTSIRRSFIHKHALFPTVVNCAGLKIMFTSKFHKRHEDHHLLKMSKAKGGEALVLLSKTCQTMDTASYLKSRIRFEI